MTWFRVDDSLPTHPRVLRIPRGARRCAALGAWVLAGAWAAGHLTDGHVPRAVLLDELGVPRRALEDLLAAGLLEEAGEELAFRDWTDRNPTRAEVEERREHERVRKAHQRASRTGHGNGARVPAGHPRDSRRDTPRDTPGDTPRDTPRDTPAAGAAFEAFWTAYPRKVGKRNAAAAFARASKRADPAAIVDGARRFAADPTREDAFTPHPATWLNRDGWLDEGPARPAPAAGVVTASTTDARVGSTLALAAALEHAQTAPALESSGRPAWPELEVTVDPTTADPWGSP